MILKQKKYINFYNRKKKNLKREYEVLPEAGKGPAHIQESQ